MAWSDGCTSELLGYEELRVEVFQRPDSGAYRGRLWASDSYRLESSPVDDVMNACDVILLGEYSLLDGLDSFEAKDEQSALEYITARLQKVVDNLASSRGADSPD